MSRPVLLVEDNELNREMLARRLRRAGLSVVVAADGREALARMREHSPAVVLMDMSLPISADINYNLGSVTLGMDYYGIGRSFNITREGTTPVYVDLSSLEFATYLQVPTLNNTVLLRAKVGYASDDFEVYAQGEKIDLGLSAFSFGDDRTQLNPDISGGIFLKFEVLYRFRIPISKSEPENNK